MVAVSEKGEMRFLDLRMAHNGGGWNGGFGGPGGGDGSVSLSGACSPGGSILGQQQQQGGGWGGVAHTPLVHTVAAHSSGGVSALVAHPHAPLIATASVNQVVKVWTDQGETVRLAPWHLCGVVAGGGEGEKARGSASIKFDPVGSAA